MQQLEQQLAPAGGLGREQHAAGEAVEEREQRRGGRIAVPVEPERRWRVGGEVPERQPGRAGRDRLDLDRIGADPVERGAAQGELRGRQEHLGRLEQRPLEVVAALLVAGDDVVPDARGRGRDVARVDRERAGGQVVEQRHQRVEAQRQVVLDAADRQALADALVDLRARGVALEALPVAAAEVADRLRRQPELTRRQQPDALETAARALRLGIEDTDAVDVGVEQVEPVGLRRAHRPQVDERPAAGELAGRRDLGHRRVARGREARAERVELKPLAGGDDQRVAGDEAWRRQTHREGLDGHHQHALRKRG